MSFSDDFTKALEEELKKKKRELDSQKVESPYAGGNSRLQDDDDDIAPVGSFDEFLNNVATTEEIAEWRSNKSKKEEKKKDSGGIFDSGAFGDFDLFKNFKDGYDFGDVAKTILGLGKATIKTTAGTALDIATEAFEGIWDVGAGIGQGIAKNIIAPIADRAGKDELADTIRENVKNNRVGEVYDSFMKPVDDWADSNSVLGSDSENLIKTVSSVYTLGAIGEAGGALGLGTKGASLLTNSITFNNSYISGLQEAYRSGATDKEAETYGIIAGASDVITEMLFGGLGKSFNALGYGKGLSSADDMLAKKVSSKMKSTLAKNFTEFGIKAGAEGFEEVLAGLAQAVGKKATYMSEEDFGKILKDENLFEQFVMGALVSGGMQSGYIPGTYDGSLRDANKSGKDFITGLNANEQSVVDKIYKDRVAEAEKNGKVTNKAKNRIYDDVLKDLEKGNISTDTIEEVLGGDTYKSYQDTVKNEDALQAEFDELRKVKTSESTLEQNDRYNELKKRLDELKTTSERDFLQKKYKSEAYEIAKGSKLEESYNERARRGQAFTADVTKYNEKQRAIVQKAIDSGILNNTNRTHEFVDMVAKISADKGVLFDFTNNEKLKNSGFAIDGKTVNGYLTKNAVEYSLSTTTDGRSVAVVDNDILSNIDTTSWDSTKKEAAKKAASDALKKYSNGIVVDGLTRKVNRTSRREYTRSNDTERLYKKSPGIFADKMRAADIADDIVVAATNWNRDGGLKHSRSDNFVDFDHGNILIISGNAKYSAKVVVGITSEGDAVLYDVVDMTPVTFDIKTAESSTTATTQNAIGDIQEDSADNSISQNQKKSTGKASNSLPNIVINIQSSKALNSIVGHEITHVLEGTELYSELQKAITEYAKTKGEYKSRYDALAELYKNVENADIDAELTADLVGDYLFTDADFVNNLSAKHRNVFQKIFDEVKYLCKVVTAGSKEARQLEKVKKTFEDAFRAETKNTAQAGGVKYSLNIKYSDGSVEVLSDARELTSDQAVEYLNKAKAGQIQGHSYIPVRKDTPQVIIDTLSQVSEKIQNRSLVMQVRKAQQAMKAKSEGKNPGKHGNNIRSHALEAEQIVEIVNNLDNPSEIIYQTNRHDMEGNSLPNNVAVFVEYNNNGTEGVAVIEFDSSIDPEYIGTEYGDTEYHTVVTVFKPDVERNGTEFDYVEELLSNPDNILLDIERKQPARSATREKVPNTSSKLLSNNSISQNAEKSSGSAKFSLASDIESRKQAQFEIIEKTNPAPNSYSTWIRSADDVKTLAETLDDSDWSGEGEFNPDLTREDIENAIESGKITVYSSYPIKNGVFVSPSRMEAESYSGDGKVYEKVVSIDDVAWIDPTQGQLAIVKDEKLSLSNSNDDLGPIGDYNVYGKDVALEGPLPDDYAPIGETPNSQTSVDSENGNVNRVDTSSKEYISFEDFANARSPVWRNVEYDDAATKSAIMQEVHDSMVKDGAVIQVSENVTSRVEESFPDLRGMKKKERTPILKEAINKLKSNLRQFLNGFKNQTFEFEVDGKVLEAKLYNTGVNEVLEKITQDKASMLYTTEEIFGNARYLYSTPDYDGDPNVYRWNYFYTPVQIGSETVGVRIAVRDLAKQGESQIYNWNIKKDASLGGERDDSNNRYPSGASSDASIDTSLDGESHGPRVASFGVSSDVSNNIIAPEPDVVKSSDETQTNVNSDSENRSLSVRELYEQKLSNHKNALNALETNKNNSLSSFDEAIRKKLEEYNGLKDKNTKRANTLLQQIENLRLRRDNVQADYASRIARQQARIEAFESKSFEEFENEVLAVRRSELQGKTVESIKDKFNENGLDLDEVLKHAKDLSTFSTVDNTPQRVMEKTLGYKEGGILADLTVNKVAQNETEGIKWLNSITDRKNGLLAQLVKDYGIKPGSKASAAAQMYAEGFYVDKNGDIIQYGDAELKADFPDSRVRENIKKLAKDERVRQFYDETLDKINESRRRNGYPEIQKLDNYFLHFRAMEDTFSRLGLPFNPNDIRAKDLPTDLNGVTADLKPGQPYFASSKHREGKRTSFDLLGGLERYATSAKNQIYHIDDIQTLRALRNYIADTYGQAKGLENLDTLTEEEVQEKIKEVYGSHLSTFAKFLNEEANVLAGKTAMIDRGLEGVIGRRAMSFMDSVNRQVGSNMVGYNISSALTNLIAPVQAFAKTNKADFIKGFAQTVSNRINSIRGKSDGFTEASPVCVRRKGSDRFHRTAWQKVSDPGYALMSAVDNFSTELIARAKYNELTRKGMDSETAHVETDKWVSRLMGDRSLGQQPQLYNSKMLGLVTKFQLEVRNQLDSQFYDTIKEAKASTEDIQNGLERITKKAAKIGSTFFTLAVGQHLFGKAFESIAGYNPAFDIIGVLIKTLGLDDDEDSEDTVLDNIEQGFFELMGDMPYTSILEGGRIPISSALPIEELYKGKDQYGNEKSRWETLGEALPYYLMPGVYGQYKKTKQGLGMFDDDLPVSGSYTDSGNLRFPVEDTLWKRVQAALFGQYASENARDYFDNERSPLKEKQIQEFIDSGISIQEYWEYREGLSGLKTLNEKADYINSLDLPVEVKNLFINNLAARNEEIDLSGMEGFESFEEYDYAQSNPGKYAVSKAVADDLAEYKQYSKELSAIESDKDKNGKTVSGSRKKNVINYINGLDLEYGQKIILFRSQYKTDNRYNHDIVEYLNDRDDISYSEMVSILTELGFKVDGKKVYWD